MDPYLAIEKRYGFSIPDSYRVLCSGGHLNYEGNRSVLSFQECEWLQPTEIASFQFRSWDVESDGGYVPFAITGRGEPYCWKLDWSINHQEPPIVYSQDGEVGTCLAPDFSSFLFRLTIEAFVGNSDVSPKRTVDDHLAKIDSMLDVLQQVLTPYQMATIRKLRTMPWMHYSKHNVWGVMPWDEGCTLIKEKMTFEHLDEEFIRDKEFIKRQFEA